MVGWHSPWVDEYLTKRIVPPVTTLQRGSAYPHHRVEGAGMGGFGAEILDCNRWEFFRLLSENGFVAFDEERGCEGFLYQKSSRSAT